MLFFSSQSVRTGKEAPEQCHPIRSIFRYGFAGAGLQYFNPHSFRNTLVQLDQDICKTPEDYKAWSQNLGHEKVLTTFTSYGEVGCLRQGEIMQALARPQKENKSEAEEVAEAVFRKLCGTGVSL